MAFGIIEDISIEDAFYLDRDRLVGRYAYTDFKSCLKILPSFYGDEFERGEVLIPEYCKENLYFAGIKIHYLDGY